MRRVILGIVLTVIVVIACTISLIYYRSSPRNIVSSTTIASTTVNRSGQVNGYYIKIYYGDRLIKKLTLSELHKLRSYVFVDSRDHEQEGPLLYGVIKYVIGNKTFKYVIVKGEQGKYGGKPNIYYYKQSQELRDNRLYSSRHSEALRQRESSTP